VERAVQQGIDPSSIIIDPGFGFAKTGDHNWQLLQRLDEFDALGLPMLVGVSRKRFLGSLLPDADGAPRPPLQRDDASAALTAILARRPVWGVRVHAVRQNRDAVAVADRLGDIGG
jgi:dihydropteroate synthase